MTLTGLTKAQVVKQAVINLLNFMAQPGRWPDGHDHGRGR